MSGLDKFEREYPATTKGFRLLILSLIQPDTPLRMFESAPVIPTIIPNANGVPPIEIINNGKKLWIISLEISVKSETNPIIKTCTEIPKIRILEGLDFLSTISENLFLVNKYNKFKKVK
jgi:hypothetical protein